MYYVGMSTCNLQMEAGLGLTLRMGLPVNHEFRY